MRSMADFKDLIDTPVFKSQNSVPASQSASQDSGNISVGAQGDMINTMFGKMPSMNAQQAHQNLMDTTQAGIKAMPWALGGPGMAIEGAATPLINEAATGAKNLASKAYDYLHPEQKAQDFMSNLGQGSQTVQENTGALAQDIKGSYDTNKAAALAKKQDVMNQVGKEKIYDVDESQLPEGNLDKVVKIIDPDIARTANFSKPGEFESQMKALSKALKDYRAGKVDKELGGEPLDSFISKAEDIFNVPELSDQSASKIEDMLSFPTKRDSAYLNNDAPDLFKGKLKDIHDTFTDNPTFKNSDRLQSSLGKKIGEYMKRSARGNLNDDEINNLESFKSARDDLRGDQNNFLQDFSPETKSMYDDYMSQWRENVTPYESTRTLRDITRRGQTEGVSPGKLGTVFKQSSPVAQKITGDIGEQGSNRVLFNQLMKSNTGNPQDLATAVMNAKMKGGFQGYITPEMEEFAQGLIKQSKRAEAMKTGMATGAGAIGGSLFGAPILGGAVGYGLRKGTPLLAKYLSKAGKK